MSLNGEWTVDGSADDLYALSARLRLTGQSGLKRNIAVGIRAATVPAAKAVKAELLSIMPKQGGANVWLAASSIRSSVLTGPKSAGVVMRGNKRGHNLARINQTGQLRHPVFGDPKVWAENPVPSGWWERVLSGFDASTIVALKVMQDLTAAEAGFL